jgi:hypothetical protein
MAYIITVLAQPIAFGRIKMTNEKVVEASSLPTIDRGTDARTKMSRERFLAFIMAGIMIVSAVSMIAPSLLGNNSQNDDQTAQVSWNPAGAREAIYKYDHLFEMYLKNGACGVGYVDNGIGWGGMLNDTIDYHGGLGAANQNAHPAKEAFLGHMNQSKMGVNEWLNTSDGPGTSLRAIKYGENTIRNNYPYIFYWTPAPSGKLTPAIDSGLATWAPFRVTATVKNDTALKTGWSDTSRKVPFLPCWNLSRGATNNFRGGYINISMYGSYVASNEMDDLSAGLHYGNWYYGMPNFAYDSSANDGYFYELHGTITLSYWALRTYLNWTPGVAELWSDGTHGKAPRIVDSTNARTWFQNELDSRGMMKNWKAWLVENYSQTPGKGGAGGGGAPYWGNLVNNGNIYTNYEFDYATTTPGYTGVGLRADPSNSMVAYNGSKSVCNQGLSIRFYYIGWGPDAAVIRMIEASNICGSFGTVGTSAWNKRAGMVNYNEELYLNTSIRENMGNSSARWVATYSMLGWEDPADDVWSGGYMIEVGSHTDYIPNIIGSQDTYPSPMNKYLLDGTGTTIPDAYVPQVPKADFTKTRDWRAPGAIVFNSNATVVLQAPAIRNLSAYEAIVFDLNLLTSPWLVAKGITAKFGGGTMALEPYQSTSSTAGAAKEREYRTRLYNGTLVLGHGCYPQTQVLAMYNANTKILNLSGGATGLTMGNVFNTDYWGGHVGQTSRVYLRGMPFIQLDVSPVSSYQVTVQSGPYTIGVPYTVTVKPVDCLGKTPRNGTGALIFNGTVDFVSNMKIAGVTGIATWPGGTSKTFTTANATVSTTIQFQTYPDANHNGYANVTDRAFNYSVGGSAVPSPSPPVSSQAMKGTSGPLTIIIPEFATVLIPIVGVMALFFIFRTRKRKREE